MKRFVRILVALALTPLVASPLAAQSKTGTTIGQFWGIEPSARHAGMGNAGVATHEGIEAVYYNPAALGAISRAEVQLSHGFWFAGIDYDYVAGALPLPGWGTVFGAVTKLGSGEIDVRTVEKPLGTGEKYTVSDVGLSLGFGRQITSRFAAGAQINYATERIWHTSQRTLTLSVGTVYLVTEEGLRIGSSLTNFGTRARFSGRDLAIQFDQDPDVFGDNSALPAEQYTDRFPVSVLFRVGASLSRAVSERSTILLSVDAFHPSDNSESVSLGGEWAWKETVALRAGYQDLFQTDSELGLTFGAGLQGQLSENRFRFDYAWGEHDHLEETHRLTFALTF